MDGFHLPDPACCECESCREIARQLHEKHLGTPVQMFTQADLDAAVAKAVEAEQLAFGNIVCTYVSSHKTRTKILNTIRRARGKR